MTKRMVICPICKNHLGNFHGTDKAMPMREHIYDVHPQEYAKIVKLVKQIDRLNAKIDAIEIQLRDSGVGQFDEHFFTQAIAHRLSTLRKADHLVILDKGQIVEQGSHDTLLDGKGLYYAMWRQQVGERRDAELPAGAPLSGALPAPA